MNEVDICNLALANLGANPRVVSIDPPDGSAESIHCARYYRTARNSTLELPWSFNTRRVLGVVLEDQSQIQAQWHYLYSMPSDQLAILAVLPLSAPDDDQTQPYKVEMFGDAQVIATNLMEATIRYAALVTNTEVYTSSCIEAMSMKLSSMLAGPVVRGESGAALQKHFTEMFLLLRGQAQVNDARNRHGKPVHIPQSIRARRGGFLRDG